MYSPDGLIFLFPEDFKDFQNLEQNLGIWQKVEIILNLKIRV